MLEPCSRDLTLSSLLCGHLHAGVQPPQRHKGIHMKVKFKTKDASVIILRELILGQENLALLYNVTVLLEKNLLKLL